ncbi:ABC transporter permease [Alkaliphilus transvaalensis]|uniref:ABC transporter permease n=1 Tax=Alkaliphilus transvaalensis TaxID=114628 RepID=UPI000B0AEE3A|nr:iron ABC transporter permease [Alkaliphilus transvaalensis]
MNNGFLEEKKHKREIQVRGFLRTFFSIGINFWNRIWRGNAPDFPLFIFASVTSALMGLPIIYVIWRSAFAGKDRWVRLLDTRIPTLLWSTLSLGVIVTIFALIIGVSLAWLVQRCNIPGRKAMQWLLALPLVIPPYVGAVTYIIILGPRGWIRDWFGSSPFNIYSFWGAAFVLTMFTYPYVFLITSAALKKMNRSFEEAARAQGLTSYEILWKVNLPLLRPAIGAGAILIFLYVLSDFGAIAMLRYNTFTSAIYYQMGSYDNLSATVLSMVLILVTLIVLWIEARTRKKQKYYQTTKSYKKPQLYQLGFWKVPVLLYMLAVFFLSVVLPITVLIYWSKLGIEAGALDQRFWAYGWNSIKVSGLAALACMVLALPIVYLKSRYKSYFTIFIDKLSYSGYALPGVIIALGMIFIFNQYIPWLYNTPTLLAIAYVIRFLPQSMQSADSSLNLISPSIDEAARSLGFAPLKVLFKVIIPLITPGVLAGGALVFVSAIKELPATLLLRPPGFDTLAVRIWVETSESVYHLAAPAALLIILVSIVPLKWMLSKY